ncbi:MAG: glycosyltransferase family 4 protein [Beijerinckiaceae bacterium]
MAPVYFVIPGDLSLPTGGYAYDRRVLALAGEAQLDLRYLPIPGSFPSPTEPDLNETARLISQTPEDAILLIDGLALGAKPPEFVRAFKRRVVALVHHPLGFECGLPAQRAAALNANEKAVLALCESVIVTSHDTARILADDFAVPREKIAVAEPGNERCPRAQGSGNAAPTIVAVGAISPRKGYDVLIDALGALKNFPWQLIVAGATDRDQDIYRALCKRVGERNLGGHVTFAGSLSDAALAQLYHVTDIFVMASHYEGYGMALTEALAHGLPIVTTLSGAAAVQAPDDAALKVPVNDPEALKIALARVMGDRELRQRMGDAAWAAAQHLPRWSDTVATIAKTLHRVAGSSAGNIS